MEQEDRALISRIEGDVQRLKNIAWVIFGIGAVFGISFGFGALVLKNSREELNNLRTAITAEEERFKGYAEAAKISFDEHVELSKATLPYPNLGNPQARNTGQVLQAKTDGYLVAFVRFSGTGSLFGQAGLVGHLSEETSDLEDQNHKVAWCHANASTGTPACTISFPVPKGWYYKIEKKPWVGPDPAAVVNFFQLE